MANNKVRFGLRNTKYAIYDAANGTYGPLKDLPGAVSLSLSREGGDSSDFYADDGIYFTFAGTNGGYSGDLELARITDQVRIDLLGEVLDEGTGVQFETTVGEAPQFAIITEMQGDQNPVGFVFYACKASRPELQANTKNDSPSVDTDTLNIRISAQEFTHLGVKKPFVQGHIEKTSENAAQYTAFFNSVVVPTAGDSPEPEPEPAADATLSALTIGSLTLTPEFAPATTSYTTTTTNSTNTITATATDNTATIAILVGETPVENGSSATWSVGENTVTITVTNGEESEVYTVTVTKSE